jgi:hypothetical protein
MHEPLSEFEKLYDNKDFSSFSNEDENLERDTRETFDKMRPSMNLNKMDENIKHIDALNKNSKFLGTGVWQKEN